MLIQERHLQLSTAPMANERPYVSVIIPTYNNAHFLPQTLDSVLEQTYQEFEVIVIDDGSTDDTETVIEPYRERIRYLKKANGGPSAARNLGIQYAKGEFIAFLDADDLWHSDKLALQIAFFQTHPEVGVVYTDGVHFDSEGVISNSIKELYDKIPSGYVFDDLFGNHCIGLSSVMVRRRCLDEVGLFDESLIGAEDYNLFLRLAQKFQFGFLDKALLHKRAHANNLSDNLDRMCEDEIKNIDKIAAMFPDKAIKRGQLKGQAYARFGRYYFAQRRFDKARHCYKQAMRRRLLSIKDFAFFALSSVPQSWRQSLLALNRQRKKLFDNQRGKHSFLVGILSIFAM